MLIVIMRSLAVITETKIFKIVTIKKMDIIFVDTSIFESENFIEGSKLKQLIDLGMKKNVKILIPEITYNEVKARIKKKLKEAKASYDQNYKNCSILRNSDNYEKAFSSRFVNVEEEYDIIVRKFDEMLSKGKAEIIPYPALNIGNVFNRYFPMIPLLKKVIKSMNFLMHLLSK